MLFALANVALANQSQVEEALARWAAEECDAVQVEVHWLGLSDPVELDPEARFVFEGEPCRRSPAVKLRVAEPGKEPWSVTMRPQLELWVEAPVATETASAGDIVRTRSGIVELMEVRGDPLEGELLARTRIEAGEPVTTYTARALPDARRGAEVTVVAQRGSLRVSAPGRLSEDGVVGAQVRVVNQVTAATLEGILVDAETVEIN
ncbi:MAG TPA: flagella basal body P-ring formation protein FlgA [Myxococcota bacterium]|nr:flagella basal body P-ring formation protein FlgA [Myxococcota bacterium]